MGCQCGIQLLQCCPVYHSDAMFVTEAISKSLNTRIRSPSNPKDPNGRVAAADVLHGGNTLQLEPALRACGLPEIKIRCVINELAEEHG